MEDMDKNEQSNIVYNFKGTEKTKNVRSSPLTRQNKNENTKEVLTQITVN